MRRCVEEAHEAQNKQCRLDVYVSICEIFRAVFARLDPLPCPVDVRREEASRESVRRVIKKRVFSLVFLSPAIPGRDALYTDTPTHGRARPCTAYVTETHRRRALYVWW